MSEHHSRNISIVRPDQFNSRTRQTSGALRQAAIAAEIGVSSQLWGGTFLVEPGARTGIHHHGEQDTIVYVLEGQSLVIWGEHGESRQVAQAGDFVHVPAYLPHQEINPSPTEPFRWIVVRSTPEPIVVNLPDDYWPAAQ
jgi:uncharacterized RmlC-like cupin family protein